MCSFRKAISLRGGEQIRSYKVTREPINLFIRTRPGQYPESENSISDTTYVIVFSETVIK